MNNPLAQPEFHPDANILHATRPLAHVAEPTELCAMVWLILERTDRFTSGAPSHHGLNEFVAWFQQAPRSGFTKATVSAWRVSLERRLVSSSIIIRMSAIGKLVAEAADNGRLAPELAQVPLRSIRRTTSRNC